MYQPQKGPDITNDPKRNKNSFKKSFLCKASTCERFENSFFFECDVNSLSDLIWRIHEILSISWGLSYFMGSYLIWDKKNGRYGCDKNWSGKETVWRRDQIRKNGG